MILANVTRAIREQNWFAVAVEFLIVIAGVVIGFQITAWNERLNEQALELRTLQRLQAESEMALSYWAEEVSDQRNRLYENRYFLETLRSGSPPGDEDAFIEGGTTLGRYPSFRPPNSVMNELISSGHLSSISDIAAREAISDYAAQVDYIQGQLDQFRLNVNNLRDFNRGKFISVLDGNSTSLRRYDYDFESMLEDADYLPTMVDATRNQVVFYFYRLGVLERAVEMCTQLSMSTGVPCENLERASAELDHRLWGGTGQE